MVLLFEVDGPFRFKPKVERVGALTRIIWGCFSVARIAAGFNDVARAFREDECEQCAAIADARAMRCEAKTATAEDEDEVTELRSLAWQFSVLAAEMRKRSNAQVRGPL
ncbi:hypothetical protein [Thiobacillus denitrificans]|uniref:Uncharacterized protein n=1 Tax=Thiobacillus denitrificans TaxID=36861 RepID=A0A119CTT7_THIDE|nr:hypothetical protein [Thiobacillus denitrificans]KVW92639.1 hypothetical protein ABW22_15800 [Thiobacillus denitrificans]